MSSRIDRAADGEMTLPAKSLRGLAGYMFTPLRSAVKQVVYYGTKRFCPVCRHSARAFRQFGVPPRSNARCPHCGSLERHRLLYRYLEQETSFFESSGAKMLHFAAEACFERRFRQLIGGGYVTADLFNPADVRMDITDIQYPANSFDIVYCSHVLEHVPNDRQAMRELCRVLKPDGWAIIMVPVTVDTTVEDPTVTDPQERLRLFGQEDHVRRYGPDIADRLQEAGFAVTAVTPGHFLSEEDIARLAVGSGRRILRCSKATEAFSPGP